MKTKPREELDKLFRLIKGNHFEKHKIKKGLNRYLKLCEEFRKLSTKQNIDIEYIKLIYCDKHMTNLNDLTSEYNAKMSYVNNMTYLRYKSLTNNEMKLILEYLGFIKYDE